MDDDFMLGLLMICAAIAVVVIAVVGGYQTGKVMGAETTHLQFLTDQAQVVTYTVPGQGECKAVMVNGLRAAEKCEGEK